MMKEINPLQAYLSLRNSSDAVLIDIRRKVDRKENSPEKSVGILDINFDKLESSSPIFVICYLGNSSLFFVKQLMERGYEDVSSVKGGFSLWRNENLPTTRKSHDEIFSDKVEEKISLLENVIAENEGEKISNLEREIKALGHLATIGELTSGIIHDIGNPLTIMDGNLRLLSKAISDGLEGKESDIQSKVLVMSQAVGRIKDISKNMKSFLHSKNGVDGFSYIELENTMKELEYILSFKTKVPISWKIRGEKIISFNKTVLMQILVNLLNNAADAVSELKDQWIYINITNDDTSFICKVINSGPKIEMDVVEKMGRILFTTKEKGSGTGLGVNIIKRYIKEFNGEFYLDNSHESTCFVFSFPLQKIE
jgi:C4-dicarboxylate-specific signal transduction histidine kinase